MTQDRITLQQVRDMLDHDRSVSSQAKIMKYISMFIDQRHLAPTLVKNTVNSFNRVKDKVKIPKEALLSRAFTFELQELLIGTKFWDGLTEQNKIIVGQQILMMSKANVLLQAVILNTIDINEKINEMEYGLLTEVDEGKLWNLKMQEAKRRKARQKEREAQEEALRLVNEEKANDITKEDIIAELGEAYVELANHMTLEELKELKELQNLTF